MTKSSREIAKGFAIADWSIDDMECVLEQFRTEAFNEGVEASAKVAALHCCVCSSVILKLKRV